ncbi:MAG: signal peptidase II [Pseudomonadota bacterium]
MGLTRALTVALVILVLDQASKWLIVEVLDLKTRGYIEVAPPFLTFVMAWNTGINFGLFGNDSDTFRWVLIGIAVAISVALAVWARSQTGWRAPAAIGLVIGGAIGNAIDRMHYGSVADFLNMSCCGIENPYAFNIADIAIFLGALVLILFTGTSEKDARDDPAPPGTDGRAGGA